MTMSFTLEEKVKCVSWSIAFENRHEAMRIFKKTFNKDPPSRQNIAYWETKLFETGSLVHDRQRSGRPVSASGDDQREIVMQSIDENNQVSVRSLEKSTGIPKSTVNRMIIDMGYHPYKPTYVQELLEDDADRRTEFCETMVAKMDNDPAWLKKLVFSDEAVFKLNGSVNKHNCHFYAKENPKVKLETSMGKDSLTVWAMIGHSGTLAFDIDPQTMNSDRYCLILNEKVFPYFRRHSEMFYQQDGAPAHFSLAARNLLNIHLPNHWIGRRGSIEWPARSPDLTPCDFWYWGHLRDLVYAKEPRTLQELRQYLKECIAQIPLDMYKNSLKSFKNRCSACIESNGYQFE